MIGSSVFIGATNMSTLGYGDITFNGNDGRLFLSCGSHVYWRILLIYCFALCIYEFLYKPFVEYQTGARIPRKFDGSDQKHLILTTTTR